MPQIAFKTSEDLAKLKEVADGVGSGSQTGESNGLALLLDVENYNIGYYKTETQGLKVAVHDYKLENPTSPQEAVFWLCFLGVLIGTFIIDRTSIAAARDEH